MANMFDTEEQAKQELASRGEGAGRVYSAADGEETSFVIAKSTVDAAVKFCQDCGIEFKAVRPKKVRAPKVTTQSVAEIYEKFKDSEDPKVKQLLAELAQLKGVAAEAAKAAGTEAPPPPPTE